MVEAVEYCRILEGICGGWVGDDLSRILALPKLARIQKESLRCSMCQRFDHSFLPFFFSLFDLYLGAWVGWYDKARFCSWHCVTILLLANHVTHGIATSH